MCLRPGDVIGHIRAVPGARNCGHKDRRRCGLSKPLCLDRMHIHHANTHALRHGTRCKVCVVHVVRAMRCREGRKASQQFIEVRGSHYASQKKNVPLPPLVLRDRWMFTTLQTDITYVRAVHMYDQHSHPALFRLLWWIGHQQAGQGDFDD